eukprot:6214252-Pleurochrysis_carterae.AAC.1
MACGSTTIGIEYLLTVSRCVNTARCVAIAMHPNVPSSGGAVAAQVMKDPPFPFHTVSIDHKTVTAPKGTKYQYMLVIVDMLTRFVTAVTAVTTSAEETLTILITHVFTK